MFRSRTSLQAHRADQHQIHSMSCDGIMPLKERNTPTSAKCTLDNPETSYGGVSRSHPRHGEAFAARVLGKCNVWTWIFHRKLSIGLMNS